MGGWVGDIVRDGHRKGGLVPMRKKRDNGFRQITSSSSRQLNGVEDLRGSRSAFPSRRC
jgi:TRAP-type C4-dicarboxylate transport system substrate-binding protein